MRIKFISMLIAALIFLTACSEKQETTNQENMSTRGVKVVVEEVLQANSYTYLKVKGDESEYWIAVTKSQIEKGETVYHEKGMEMKNFESRDLNRTFETVYFVQELSRSPLGKKMDMVDPAAKQRTTTEIDEKIQVETAEGGISITELYSNKESYSGKTVKIRGRVMKFNASIMGRNWIHLQDGSKEHDLTVTSNEAVNVGDIVTFEGKITLDKDFGAGYYYEVIMEEAGALSSPQNTTL